jgi:hypothetical protein
VRHKSKLRGKNWEWKKKQTFKSATSASFAANFSASGLGGGGGEVGGSVVDDSELEVAFASSVEYG